MATAATASYPAPPPPTDHNGHGSTTVTNDDAPPPPRYIPPANPVQVPAPPLPQTVPNDHPLAQQRYTLALPKYFPDSPQHIPQPPKGPTDFFNYPVEDWLSVSTSPPWCTYFYNDLDYHLATYIRTDNGDNPRYLASLSFPEDWRFLPGWHRHLNRSLEECFTSHNIPHHLHFPSQRPNPIRLTAPP